jgi:hypothetical protein
MLISEEIYTRSEWGVAMKMPPVLLIAQNQAAWWNAFLLEFSS